MYVFILAPSSDEKSLAGGVIEGRASEAL